MSVVLALRWLLHVCLFVWELEGVSKGYWSSPLNIHYAAQKLLRIALQTCVKQSEASFPELALIEQELTPTHGYVSIPKKIQIYFLGSLLSAIAAWVSLTMEDMNLSARPLTRLEHYFL